MSSLEKSNFTLKSLELHTLATSIDQNEVVNIQPYAYFFQQGREFISEGNYEAAIAVYRQGNQQHADNPFSYLMLGCAYGLIGDYSQELDYYYQALQLDSDNHKLNYNSVARSDNNCSTLNQNQIKNIYQKIVDAAINSRQFSDLLLVVNEVKNRIEDINFYLNNGRKIAKLEEFAVAISFLEQAKKNWVEDNFSGSQLDEIEYLIASLKKAQINKSLVKNKDYKIISLGSDCLPRTISTIWGLKPRKKSGELSCPFDLALHPYGSVVEVIDTDFSNYLNTENLIAYPIQKGYDRSEKFTCVKNTYYDFIFSHERDKKFVEDNFAKFIDVYRRRISNFYKYLNSSPILFIVYSDVSIEINRLAKVLSSKFPSLKFKILLIMYGSNLNLTTRDIDERIIIHKVEGFEDYRWPTMNATRIVYEQNIADAIKAVIISNF